MNGDASLISSLVERLSDKLPHRTGSNSHDLRRDELVLLSRNTLIKVSGKSIASVLDALLSVLEDLSRPYNIITAHPTHVLQSELYILELLADCSTAHWEYVNVSQSRRLSEDTQSLSSDGSWDSGTLPRAHSQIGGGGSRKGSRVGPPTALSGPLIERIMRIMRLFLAPVGESNILAASNILDDGSSILTGLKASRTAEAFNADSSQFIPETSRILEEKKSLIEAHARIMIEFASASNWPYIFENLTLTLRGLRQSYLPPGGAQTHISPDEERAALVSIRTIESFYVDGRKLGLVIQEIWGGLLHMRKSFQNAVATSVPQLISRWIERDPEEFVGLHLAHKRLDGSADTLFDMTNGMVDAARRKNFLVPFQAALLLLLPDVFEVASNMRDAKSTSMAKKVRFLDEVRKSLRTKAESAYAMISILRVARHFTNNSEAALLSYALDIQDELREALFRKYIPGVDAAPFDSGLLTAAFVALTDVNLDMAVDSLLPICVGSNSPQEFRVAAMSACAYFALRPNEERHSRLLSNAAPFIRSQLKGLLLSQKNSDINEQYPLFRSPKLMISTPVLHCILRFLDIAPLTIFENTSGSASELISIFEDCLSAFIVCLMIDDEGIRILTNAVARRMMIEGTKYLLGKFRHPDPNGVQFNFWKSTSIPMVTISDQARISNTREKHTLEFLHDYIQARIKLHRSIEDIPVIISNLPEHVAASENLETVYLVALCSPDIETCQLVTSCISMSCEEGNIMDSAGDLGKSFLTIFRNVRSYMELSSRDFRFTGLVAFQKRVRGHLRAMKYPTAGILTAWEIVFDKWYELSKQILAAARGEVDERSLVVWRNYSGFLASLGGICISDQAGLLDETGLAGLRWIDRLSSDSYEETLLDRYMIHSIRLLASNNPRVREATREVLSSEISAVLYLPLFKVLESELEALFNGQRNTSSVGFEARLFFAEQAAALLKTIVERLGSPADIGTALSIDIGALTLNFARFLDVMPEGLNITTLKVKIKLCQLCEIVTRKKELLNLRHDVRIRNQLLEVLFGWITRPSSPRVDNSVLTGPQRVKDIFKLQHDLDRACLKALADLTYRLPLQPPDGQTDANTSDLKSKMFHSYFNRFLSLLNYETTELGREGSITAGGREDATPHSPELAITALSNLLGANIDVGLKHSLSIGYHEDLEIRTAFVKVLCNILVQGTEFNTLSDGAVSEKYDKLLELLISDMKLTIALCDACPSTEVDEMTISLLNIFDSRGLGYVLLRALIEHEVEQTESEAELLRRNCVATKMLSVYAKWKGAIYLRKTLSNVLERLLVTSKDLDLELDPARTSSPEELKKNAIQLRVVTQVFIDDICNSAVNIPASFRKICSLISTSVMTRFPDAKFTAVGSFIFLRFFCPAIVAPDAEGLISAPPSKEMRRGLLLIAKVVQNLANNVLFGAKEPYMFPLNDFLTQNIYRVTTFLRGISATPDIQDLPTLETESFDFGSCLALHRFLYDHWDLVRQNLIAQERSTTRIAQGKSKDSSPILDSVRSLITNLGPPPTDVSWNRPLISANSPPAYSRFQHFMLQNAGRDTEMAVSSRAIYDGGESKDGLSMICVILRNADTEPVEYDLLLYCYLKIASRMWHRPFGILVDATCYSGHSEPPDSLFRKLDSLTPSELTKNLSRIYIYNMNSAFRKCFRRILRLSSKNEQSAFHPKNVEYHLIGSLQDLQAHFHLSQVHLPKETISVVTDTRFVFQPITRLSKTKGKIEVVIKVGSQFVQVTTTKKQEVVTGLRPQATVNDIFRLSDIDEAPTSIQTEDDSAFGLRADNGKIVMFFQSPRKQDILQAIRGAKVKLGKELKAPKSFERLIRPQDVPGTLLNIALSNMSSVDRVLRVASYNLLCALCKAFKFSVGSKILTAKELYVPLQPSHFVVNISQQLAQSEPQLTVDFLNEFFVGWNSFPYTQRPLSLAYMAPWLPSLRKHVLPNEIDSEKAREKVAVIFRKLIDVAMSDLSLNNTLEQTVWPSICQDEINTEVFLEEVIKAALNFGADDDRTEVLGSVLSSLGTITTRGKLLAKLRKTLNRTSLRPTRYLPDNAVWSEICVLLRLSLSMSFDSGSQSQLYLPELFHLVTMLANTGSPDIRLVVQRLLVNTLHAIRTTFTLEEANLARLTEILSLVSDPRNELLASSTGLTREGSISQLQEMSASTIASTDALTALLAEVSVVAAPSVDLSNAWRSRWMSLVASTAFQSNPAIQPRAFTVMGCLAKEDVDDDLLYQVLVALRNSINRFIEDNDHEMLIAIVTSLTKMMEKLPTASRYGLQLFWLAISLVRLVPMHLFNCTSLFLDAVLNNISTSREFQDGRLVPVLMQGRVPLEDAAYRLDQIYGVHFNKENFHFAVCASLVKGLTTGSTKGAALRVLCSFLEITNSSMPANRKFPADLSIMPYLGLVMSRAMSSDLAAETLWISGISGVDTSGIKSPGDVLEAIDYTKLKDKELLLNVALILTDFRYLEDTIQHRCLQLLNRIAVERPTVILHLYNQVFTAVEDVLLSCHHPGTLTSAHGFLNTLTSNPQLAGTNIDNTDLLDQVLQEIGFSGLWRAATFHQEDHERDPEHEQEHDRECAALTERLIELIIA